MNKKYPISNIQYQISNSKNHKFHKILLEIVERKKKDISMIKGKDLRGKFRSLFSDKNKTIIIIIAEVKFASPVNPYLGSPEELLARVMAYEEAGADAISVITEKHFFKGDSTFVTQVKKRVKIPVLQKDFVIDAYQIYEAKLIGSDALLLIARLVTKETLRTFVALAQDLGLEPVVEINDEEDLEKALGTTTAIIAVNARDLETFEVDVQRACVLLRKIPEKYIRLGFSGVNGAAEVNEYKDAGAHGVLIGTALMKARSIGEFVKGVVGRE